MGPEFEEATSPGAELGGSSSGEEQRRPTAGSGWGYRLLEWASVRLVKLGGRLVRFGLPGPRKGENHV